MSDMQDTPLTGYVLHGQPGGFVHRNGPVYVKYEDRSSTLQLTVGPEHTNAAGIASGGLMMMLLDITLGTHVSAAVGFQGICPTVQMSCNLISAARIGDVLVGESEISRIAKSMVFATGHLSVEGRKVATASGVFHLPPQASRTRDGNGKDSTLRTVSTGDVGS